MTVCAAAALTPAYAVASPRVGTTDSAIRLDAGEPVSSQPAPHPVAPKLQVLRLQPQADLAQSRAARSAGPRSSAAPAVTLPATRTAPFQLVGLTWAAKEAPPGIDISVRVREQGRWGTWQTLGVEDAGPDPDTAEGRAAASIAGSDPLLSDGADGVQVVVHTATGRAPAGLKVDLIDAGTSAADGKSPAVPAVTQTAPSPSAPRSEEVAAAVTPAGVGAPAGRPSSAPLFGVITGKNLAAGPQNPPRGGASPAPFSAAPAIITRAQWGADESIRKPVAFNSTVRAMVIHHTDTTNSYTTLAQAEQQVRAVYAFHVKGRGWSDIGYNFVVDRFGHIFEGRAGSITKAVLGAHTGGFNTDTMGVAALGTFVSAHPPAAMVTSIARVVAWKMGEYHANINGKVTLTSAGGGTSRYSAGTRITVNAVTGHRTFGHTTCPGDELWAELASIRSQATAIVAKQPAGTGYWPVTGVWTAGGGLQPGWFRDGFWSLRRPNGTTLQVHFGTTGDIPVVADWNGDGVTGIGVVRAGTWYVTSGLTGTPAYDDKFDYGRPGDIPLVGVWPGQSRLGIGVVDQNKWYLRRSILGSPGVSDVPTFTYGVIGDEPVAADWDGNGTSTPGVLRPGAAWYLLDDVANTQVDRTLSFGRFLDVASVGDWDGNGSGSPSVVWKDNWYVRNDLLGGSATTVITFPPPS